MIAKRRNEYVTAERYLRHAIEAENSPVEAHVQYGVLLQYYVNRPQEALLQYEIAIERDDKCAEAKFQLGVLKEQVRTHPHPPT